MLHRFYEKEQSKRYTTDSVCLNNPYEKPFYSK